MKNIIRRAVTKLKNEGYGQAEIQSFTSAAQEAGNEMEIVLLLAEMTDSDVSSIEAEIL